MTFRMLKKLSGKAHTVYTGVCIIAPDTTVAFTEATKVYFSKLSNDEIRTYVQSGDCNDKAGAYGIQGDAAKFVEKIKSKIMLPRRDVFIKKCFCVLRQEYFSDFFDDIRNKTFILRFERFKCSEWI